MMDMKNMSKADMEHWRMHKRKKGLMMLVLGAIFLVNVYQPWGIGGMNWWGLIGALLAIAGFWKLIMPGCCCGMKK